MTGRLGIDARLEGLDPAPVDARPRVADTDWGRAVHDTITSGRPGRSRPRLRRGVAAGAATAMALAIVALMAVLILSSGGDAPTTAGRQVVLVATPDARGPAVTPESLRAAAAMLAERARLIGAPAVTAAPRGGVIDLTVPADAPPDLVTWLRAPGRLTIVPDEPVGGRATSLDAAVRAAQSAAGAPVVGGGLEAVPAGFVVARQDIVRVGRAPSSGYVVYRRTLPLTEAGVSSARAEASSAAPVVEVSLTPAGAEGFFALTRRAAQNGQIRGRLQGIAIILDDRLITNPVVDYNENPNGIRGEQAQVLIPDDLDARAVAAELSEGPLPLRLTPEAVP